MLREERRKAFRQVATRLDRIDVAVYERFGRDPLEPIIGMGPRQAKIAVLGRDPGTREVEHAMPFVGAGGQKIRRGLYQALHGAPLPSFEASLALSKAAFWANTVPYKPVGNKPWPMAVQRTMQPLIADVLLREWSGRHVLCFGQKAFHWFGLTAPETKKALQAHWAHVDRFTRSIDVTLQSGELSRVLTLHALPHPSPLNRAWAGRFPGLLDACLGKLGLSATDDKVKAC